MSRSTAVAQPASTVRGGFQRKGRCVVGTGKVWLITGAGRGMGASLTRAAMAAGDAVVATGRRPGDIEQTFGISDRLLARLGWEAHKPQRWHRNYIRRYYGEYPTAAPQTSAVAFGRAAAQ